MKSRRIKILGACVLGLSVTLCGLVMPKAYAANAVDINQMCSIEFSLQNSVYDAAAEPDGALEKTEDFAELNDLLVRVKLYKVADIKETGDYAAVHGFEELELGRIDHSDVAAVWEKRAKKAKALLREDEAPDAVVTLENGTGKAEGLSAGMYLIVADEVQSSHFTYTFKENLISLPNNYYDVNGSDGWTYDLTGKNAVGLKPDREELKGNLVIDKEESETIVNKTDKHTIVTNVVKTGDTAKVLLFSLMTCISGIVFLMTVVFVIKNRKKDV